nr:Nad9 [Chlorella vulgaris]
MTNLQWHLFEIKLRSIYLIFSTICTFFLFSHYQLELIYIMGKPFIEQQQTFIFLELTEAFYTLLRISTILTVFVIIPFLFYHMVSFLIPSFYKIERNRLIFFFFFFIFLFKSEVFFLYFCVIPKICEFLLSFEITSANSNSAFSLIPLVSVEFTARIESYVKLLVRIFTIAVLVFQIPPGVCFFLSKKIFHVSFFYSNRQILSVISLVASAFFVPPEIISQLIVAFLFFLGFEFLIFVGFFFE